MMMDTIQTRFGTAKIDCGYYRVVSKKEGNYGKTIHRLVYEETYGIIPEGYVIHHIDENKLNNDISNLQMLTPSEHASIHMMGEKNPFYGKKGINRGKRFSPETRKKISENHADVNGENNPRWGTSEIEEWGGLWFLKEIKKQLKTMKKVSDYTGLTIPMINAYVRRRGYTWTTLLNEEEAI